MTTAQSSGTRTWEAALFAVAMLWLGMLLGVSFLATPAKCILCAIVASLVVIAETFWLLPVLDQRVGLIIAGQRPAASYQHNLYIILDIVKLIALALVAFDMARQLARGARPPRKSWISDRQGDPSAA